MALKEQPKHYRFPLEIMSHAIGCYHRRNDSYRDISEEMLMRGIAVSHETIRQWCLTFGHQFSYVIKKRMYNRGKHQDKWHLDEMIIKMNGERYYLWRAVDADGYELDILLQKRRNKKAALRFIKRLLGSYPTPRVIITDKLKSYNKPIRSIFPNTDHRKHKGSTIE